MITDYFRAMNALTKRYNKMTIIQNLHNKRVIVESQEHSEVVQKALTKQGFVWGNSRFGVIKSNLGNLGTCSIFTDDTYILHYTKSLTLTQCQVYFYDGNFHDITKEAEDRLARYRALGTTKPNIGDITEEGNVWDHVVLKSNVERSICKSLVFTFIYNGCILDFIKENKLTAVQASCIINSFDEYNLG